MAHELALFCLDKENLPLDLKMQSVTFAAEIEQMPRGVLQ